MVAVGNGPLVGIQFRYGSASEQLEAEVRRGRRYPLSLLTGFSDVGWLRFWLPFPMTSLP